VSTTMKIDNGWKARRRLKRTIYYKVQLYDSTSNAWRDIKPGFDDLDAAREQVRNQTASGANARLMMVDGRKRTPIPHD
jgi:hypothetical protein